MARRGNMTDCTTARGVAPGDERGEAKYGNHEYAEAWDPIL